MGLAFLKVSLDGIIDLARSLVRRRKVKLKIENPRLARPDLVATYFVSETLESGFEEIEDPDSLPFQFYLNFRLSNPSNESVGDLEYSVVVEHDSPGPEKNTVTTNFEGEILEYNGLSEPQVAPVLIQTDLDSEIILKNTDEMASHSTHRLDLNHDIILRIKAIAANTPAGGQFEISLQRLLRDWISDCRGIDMRRFADNPASIDADLSELPSMVVGEDVGTELRSFR